MEDSEVVMEKLSMEILHPNRTSSLSRSRIIVALNVLRTTLNCSCLEECYVVYDPCLHPDVPRMNAPTLQSCDSDCCILVTVEISLLDLCLKWLGVHASRDPGAVSG